MFGFVKPLGHNICAFLLTFVVFSIIVCYVQKCWILQIKCFIIHFLDTGELIWHYQTFRDEHNVTETYIQGVYYDLAILHFKILRNGWWVWCSHCCWYSRVGRQCRIYIFIYSFVWHAADGIESKIICSKFISTRKETFVFRVEKKFKNI